MEMLKNSFNKNTEKFWCSAAALILGLIACILYLATGVIKGFTDAYSVPMILIMIIGIIANAIFLLIRKSTVEMIPFMAYIIAVFLFLQVNANYIVAVIRAIDITRVSSSFIATIVCLVLAAVVYLIGFCFKGKAE